MRIASVFCALLVGLTIAAAPAADDNPAFAVDTLAEGVHLFSPADDSPRFTNALVIELPQGLMVIDAQPTVASARRLLEAIGARFDAPVRFLVFSHPHADAIGGAPAFPPQVLRIGTVRAMRHQQDPAADFDAESFALDGSEARERTLPTVALGGPTFFPMEGGQVELRPAGRAHSGGDLIVLIPERGIAAVGDLASLSLPPFSVDGSLSGWVTVLGAVIRETPQRVVPLRGPVMGLPQLRERRLALSYLTNQIGAAFVVPVPVPEIADWVFDQESFEEWFGDPGRAGTMRSLIEIGIEENLVIRRKRGIID